MTRDLGHTPAPASEDEAAFRFARWKKVFDPLYDRLVAIRRVTDTQLSQEIGVTRAAFSNWRTRSVPKLSAVPSIALALANRNPTEARDIEQQLYTALGHGGGTSSTEPPLIRAQLGKIVRMAVVQYADFTSFFHEVGDMLLKFAAVYPALDDHVNLTTIAEGLSKYRYDIAGAIFATPERLKSMRFITTPLKIGIAEVSGRTSLPDISFKILPIVNKGEVGATYAEFILGHEPPFQLVDYDKKKFAGELFLRLKLQHRAPLVRPVVYVDEVMAIDTVVELFNMLLDEITGNGLTDPDEIRRLTPCFDFSDNNERKPAYNLSFASYREEKDWYDYLSESWSIFCSSNIQYLVERYSDLFERLSQTRIEVCEKLSRRILDLQPNVDATLIRESFGQLETKWTEAIKRWLRFDIVVDSLTAEAKYGDGGLARSIIDTTPTGGSNGKVQRPLDSSRVSAVARTDALLYPWKAVVTESAIKLWDKLNDSQTGDG